MTTLTDFLLARIAEDEAKARAADSGRWLGQDKGITFEWDADDWHDDETQARLEADMHANQHHISNWGPRRVLAECEAKRRIVEFHGQDVDRDFCATCSGSGPRAQGWPCDTLRALAQVYADHPDYQPEWSTNG